MAIVDFITELFCRVDDQINDVSGHSQQSLAPSELATIGILYAIKGVGVRAFYRWLSANHLNMFPRLPERTRLFRRLQTHQYWVDRFMASPTLVGIVDTYGIELIHPVREGRSETQIGKKGKSNHRWIVGGKLCVILDNVGRVLCWDCDRANVYDATFHPLIERFEESMVILGDSGFHSASGDPSNLKICKRGEWNERMKVETVLSMLTNVCHIKKTRHRVWDYFRAHLGYPMAAFNIMAQWDGLEPDEHGVVRLSIARFTL